MSGNNPGWPGGQMPNMPNMMNGGNPNNIPLGQPGMPPQANPMMGGKGMSGGASPMGGMPGGVPGMPNMAAMMPGMMNPAQMMAAAGMRPPAPGMPGMMPGMSPGMMQGMAAMMAGGIPPGMMPPMGGQLSDLMKNAQAAVPVLQGTRPTKNVVERAKVTAPLMPGANVSQVNAVFSTNIPGSATVEKAVHLPVDAPSAVPKAKPVPKPTLTPEQQQKLDTWCNQCGIVVDSSFAHINPKELFDAVSNVKRCHLHAKKLNHKCKFCKRWIEGVKTVVESFLKGKDEKVATEELVDEEQKCVEVTNENTFNMPPVLRDHIMTCRYFRETLIKLEDTKSVISQIIDHADHCEPYSAGSNTLPSTLFCCLYRIFMLKLSKDELLNMVQHDSELVRCTGFLYIRFGLSPENCWDWLSGYLCDEQEIFPGVDKERMMSVGHYVGMLLSEEKYYTILLPRMPMTWRRSIGSRLLLLPDQVKRYRANKRIKSTWVTPNLEVEVQKPTGKWMEGEVIEYVEELQSRLAVRVRTLDGLEDVVPLWCVVLRGPPPKKEKEEGRSRSRSRSPRRGSAHNEEIDWTRHKGDKDMDELLKTYLAKEQEKAVTGGKDFTRGPLPGFRTGGRSGENTSRTQGFAVEGGTSDSSTLRQKEEDFMQRRKMAELFEKYGPQAGTGNYGSKSAGTSRRDLEGPDVGRLG